MLKALTRRRTGLGSVFSVQVHGLIVRVVVAAVGVVVAAVGVVVAAVGVDVFAICHMKGGRSDFQLLKRRERERFRASD